MQQSTNTNGVQVVVLAQTPPTGTQRNSYGNMTNEIAQTFNAYGRAQLIIGSFCVFFQIIALPFSYLRDGHGIWIGSLFIVTGAFGIFAGKKRGKCQVIAFHVLSTISASLALLMFCLSAVGVSSIRFNAWLAVDALMMLLSLAAGSIAILSSVICCTMGACCCNCGGSCCCPTVPQYQQFDNPHQSDLAQQQIITGNQQQPVFNLNPQQQMFNPNPQQPMFNPNPQQAMFNPNQQQQLPMFFPTQSMAGLYPQQYVTQLHAHQQNVSPNQPQPTTSASLPGAMGQETHTVEYNGAKPGPIPTDASTESSGGRSYEDFLICFNDSDLYPPPESAPPYDNDSGWNSHI